MQPNQNSNGMLNGLPPVPQENKKIGPIVGVLVIVLLIIIAALYFFSQKLNTSSNTNADVIPETQMDEANNKISSSTSDTNSSAAIQADLDAQLKDIDYSF